MDIDLPDETATERLAGRLAAMIGPGDVVALWGDLGCGKTSLVRALVRQALGDDLAEVPSPTFTLVQTYDLPMGILWHFDLYRIGAPDELEELGWDEARASGIAVVEWPDRLGPLLPADRLDIHLEFGDAPGTRRVHGVAHGSWSGRPLARLAESSNPCPAA